MSDDAEVVAGMNDEFIAGVSCCSVEDFCASVSIVSVSALELFVPIDVGRESAGGSPSLSTDEDEDLAGETEELEAAVVMTAAASTDVTVTASASVGLEQSGKVAAAVGTALLVSAASVVRHTSAGDDEGGGPVISAESSADCWADTSTESSGDVADAGKVGSSSSSSIASIGATDAPRAPRSLVRRTEVVLGGSVES